MENFNEYLATIDDQEHRARMKEMLKWVSTKFPLLSKRIAWNQPMFTDHGTFIIGFSVSKKHIAISPEVKTIKLFSDEIKKSGYDYTTNLIRFPWNKSIDYELLEKLIQYNIKDKENCSTFWRK